MWKENRKIINFVDDKTFQPELKTGQEKLRLIEREKTCLRRDLIEKGLGQNKILCNFFMKSNCPWSTTM